MALFLAMRLHDLDRELWNDETPGLSRFVLLTLNPALVCSRDFETLNSPRLEDHEWVQACPFARLNKAVSFSLSMTAGFLLTNFGSLTLLLAMRC